MRELYLHRRFFLWLLGGIFGLVMAYIFPFVYFWALGSLWVLGMLVVADIVLLYSFGRPVEARRILTDKLSNGEENPVTVEVESRYPFAVQLRVLDEIPPEFQVRNICLSFCLKPGEAVGQGYTLRPVRRGEYGFGKLRVFVSTRLSLVERRYSFGTEQKIAVYPSFLSMRKYELLALTGQETGHSLKKIRSAAVTTSFEHIKPYVQGDDPRAVNWKATAKCNRLMVNVFTEEKAQPVYCVTDKGRTMQSPFLGMTTLDYAINAALALSHVILRKGDKAGLLTFSNRMGTCVRADNRRLQLNRINEALYNQQTGYPESDFEQLYLMASRYLHVRSLLIVFTNFDTVNGMKRHLPALRRLAKSHLVLLVLFENTEINRLMEVPAVSMREVCLKTVAAGFITEKRRIVAELRKAGIYTLLTGPERLTTDAIHAYLGLKARGIV